MYAVFTDTFRFSVYYRSSGITNVGSLDAFIVEISNHHTKHLNEKKFFLLFSQKRILSFCSAFSEFQNKEIINVIMSSLIFINEVVVMNEQNFLLCYRNITYFMYLTISKVIWENLIKSRTITVLIRFLILADIIFILIRSRSISPNIIDFDARLIFHVTTFISIYLLYSKAFDFIHIIFLSLLVSIANRIY